MPVPSRTFDVVIVGSGVSGSFIAHELASAGARCAVLEAGAAFDPPDYPSNELEGNASLYWSGGVELDTRARLCLLRPKVVGGGSVVNQALLDRFDDDALGSWRVRSGLEIFDSSEMAAWYARAEAELALQEIPEKHWNRNARIFREGFAKNGFRCAPLRRAQKDCRYEEGNDCIVCLNGCPISSKQSAAVTVLASAIAKGVTLVSGFEARQVGVSHGVNRVTGIHADGREETFFCGKLVLAAGAVGTTKLLLASGFGERLPWLGRGFFTHPQFMVFARYAEPVDAHRGPFQALKSDEPEFRRGGFKLENVFAPPGGLAMLLPLSGRRHAEVMKGMRHLACIEVAVRDTCAGRVTLDGGAIRIRKRLNREDRRRRDRGLAAVDRIFRSTGALEIFPGAFPVGLHLMGGCAMGTDPQTSVVDARSRLHGHDGITIADSSVFPDAPGINPSLTIMALSIRAADFLRRSV